jgi:hypothetical protein
MNSKMRARLVSVLREKIERIVDPTKRAATVSKIGERLGDTAYWVNYAERLFEE